MNLTIDIGNTRTKIGIFDNQKRMNVLSFENYKTIDLLKIISENKIQKVIISSTIEIPLYLLDALKMISQVIILNAKTKLPFQNNYSTKDTLGRDRIALIAAAQANYPSQNNLVIGCGTCVTFNFINQKKRKVLPL